MHGGLTSAAEKRESARLRALYDLRLLDTPESEAFDRITRLASLIFDVPIAAVSLTDRDRQWFKSHIGTDGREIPRLQAPCAAVCESSNVLVVEDMQADPFFVTSPLAQSGIRFYVGAPLITREGHNLGAMCVLDRHPRSATPEQISALRDMAALVMNQIELQHAFGRRDALTGLSNRHQFLDDIADLKRQSIATSRVVMLVDLLEPRHSRDISSTLGNDYVDVFLRESIAIVKNALGTELPIYHVGATSYAILLDEDKFGPWHVVMTTLDSLLANPIVCNTIPIATATVFGIVHTGNGDISALDLLRMATSAADDARSSIARHAVYSPATDAANRRRFNLISDFSKALTAPEQLYLAFQPRVIGASGVCNSAEALLRWAHPVFGNVPPAEFIPLIEQTALAQPLTEWVIDKALGQLAIWERSSHDIGVSVNVSAHNLEEVDFAERLLHAARRHGIAAQNVELEFTESALIRDAGKVIKQLCEIRKMGFEIAIDDFGSGYSNFAYLRDIPANIVKLDQSFIRKIDNDERDRNLAASMIRISHDMGSRVVAEGVENENILNFLVNCGCDEMQGYFICRPVLPDALSLWLASRR